MVLYSLLIVKIASNKQIYLKLQNWSNIIIYKGTVFDQKIYLHWIAANPINRSSIKVMIVIELVKGDIWSICWYDKIRLRKDVEKDIWLTWWCWEKTYPKLMDIKTIISQIKP